MPRLKQALHAARASADYRGSPRIDAYELLIGLLAFEDSMAAELLRIKASTQWTSA